MVLTPCFTGAGTVLNGDYIKLLNLVPTPHFYFFIFLKPRSSLDIEQCVSWTAVVAAFPGWTLWGSVGIWKFTLTNSWGWEDCLINYLRGGMAGTEIPLGGGRRRLYFALHCHHQNGSCITMGSAESRFNVSFIVPRQCPQITIYEDGR